MPVEPATLDDLDALCDLWVTLAQEQRRHGSHLADEGNRTLMREALAAHVVDHTCFVVRESAAAAPIGFVSFELERDALERDATRGVIQNLYVVPEARGRGHGTDLLDAAEGALTAAGAERLVLEAMWSNRAAREFYEERGYDPHRVSYERRPD